MMYMIIWCIFLPSIICHIYWSTSCGATLFYCYYYYYYYWSSSFHCILLH